MHDVKLPLSHSIYFSNSSSSSRLSHYHSLPASNRTHISFSSWFYR